jgi:hypothetical protein
VYALLAAFWTLPAKASPQAVQCAELSELQPELQAEIEGARSECKGHEEATPLLEEANVLYQGTGTLLKLSCSGVVSSDAMNQATQGIANQGFVAVQQTASGLAMVDVGLQARGALDTSSAAAQFCAQNATTGAAKSEALGGSIDTATAKADEEGARAETFCTATGGMDHRSCKTSALTPACSSALKKVRGTVTWYGTRLGALAAACSGRGASIQGLAGAMDTIKGAGMAMMGAGGGNGGAGGTLPLALSSMAASVPSSGGNDEANAAPPADSGHKAPVENQAHVAAPPTTSTATPPSRVAANSGDADTPATAPTTPTTPSTVAEFCALNPTAARCLARTDPLLQ